MTSTLAALTSGKTMAAIATIELLGAEANHILGQTIRPLRKTELALHPGHKRLGTFLDGEQPVDQVLVACEDRNRFAIHCHGNPMIAARILEVLHRLGSRVVTDRQFVMRMGRIAGWDTIRIENELALPDCRTQRGIQLIANQLTRGIGHVIRGWLDGSETMHWESLQADVRPYLDRAQAVKSLCYGIKTLVLGPPNSGKSTLVNRVSLSETSIVSDAAGTTRDWVTAACRLEDLYLALIDTAGLSVDILRQADSVDVEAQRRTLEKVAQADLILLVLDRSRSIDQLRDIPFDRFRDKMCVTILNKSDLPGALDEQQLPNQRVNLVSLSAKTGQGLDRLAEAIHRVSGIQRIGLDEPALLTDRQMSLCQSLTSATTPDEIRYTLTQLLSGPIEDEI